MSNYHNSGKNSQIPALFFFSKWLLHHHLLEKVTGHRRGKGNGEEGLRLTPASMPRERSIALKIKLEQVMKNWNTGRRIGKGHRKLEHGPLPSTALKRERKPSGF
jgi:hypothetical protein